MRSKRRYRVYGRVQGVGFRAFVWRQAADLGIDGWTRNCHDGTVEVLAAAEDVVLDNLLSRLEQGPRWSRVDRVEELGTGDEPHVDAGFAIRRDA
jgi:acylphosphatase